LDAAPGVDAMAPCDANRGVDVGAGSHVRESAVETLGGI